MLCHPMSHACCAPISGVMPQGCNYMVYGVVAGLAAAGLVAAAAEAAAAVAAARRAARSVLLWGLAVCGFSFALLSLAFLLPFFGLEGARSSALALGWARCARLAVRAPCACVLRPCH